MAKLSRREQFLADRRTMDWTRSALARFVRQNERTIRNYESGAREIPPAIADWLREMVRLLRANPPPDFTYDPASKR